MCMEFKIILRGVFACVCTLFLLSALATAADEAGGENASNPLAKVKNTDLRWQYLDVDTGHVNDFFIDGAFMANDKLKLKYELHYWETDITGNSEHDLESVNLKAIYFAKDGIGENFKYRLALGLDWIVDLGDSEKGIGSGSDQLAPFGGLALGLPGGVALIPLVQQFLSYSGKDVNTTAFRLIAMKQLPKQMWIKLDARAPIDWENDKAVPATAELQLGKNINKNIGLYVDGLMGLGSDKPYDWGLGTGLRFKY
jgi:hypothetical protein